jgi:hypothetical protein
MRWNGLFLPLLLGVVAAAKASVFFLIFFCCFVGEDDNEKEEGGCELLFVILRYHPNEAKRNETKDPTYLAPVQVSVVSIQVQFPLPVLVFGSQ